MDFMADFAGSALSANRLESASHRRVAPIHDWDGLFVSAVWRSGGYGQDLEQLNLADLSTRIGSAGI